MKKGLFKSIVVLMLFSLLLLVGCSATKKDQAKETPKEEIKLATTTSTTDTGLLDYLLPKFEKKYNIKVKVISVGTGQAIKIGQQGDADVLLVHSRKDEDQFIKDGFGVDRKDVMYNDFVILGPESDPAGLKAVKKAADAFAKIAKAKGLFVARGDDSGTDKREKSIWVETKITPKGNSWYIENGGGMADTLRMASEKGAYTLSDRGTYLAQKDKLKLKLLVEGDKKLLNPYGIIAVNPAKFPNVKKDAAKKFVDFMVSAEGQKLIGNFGQDKFGQALFVPNATK